MKIIPILLLTLSAHLIANEDLASPKIIDPIGSIAIEIPEYSLAPHSLQITTRQRSAFPNWTAQNHADSYSALQKIVSIWKNSKTANQYLMYGTQQKNIDDFRWEIVPFEKANTAIERIWRQFLVLWRTTFGGLSLTDSQKSQERDRLKEALHQEIRSMDTAKTARGTDPFCQVEIIHKQRVLEGHKINVLYNYAPIGFGGERLHFLIVPKEHKQAFSDLSEEEYVEAQELAQKLIRHFEETRNIEEIYLFHKTGADAGQTVPHWHMHLILTANKTQGILGKITVLKNMLFGSSPLSQEELASRVSSFQKELKSVQTLSP